MAILNGKPVKAFIYQDHQAHIQVHMAAMQDPKIMELVGQNPMAQQIQAAMMAHLNEHIAFEYRKQIEEQLGVPLPAPDEELPEDIELEVSRLAAAAAQKLLNKNQAEAQQQQIQQQMQDPVIQMQQKEIDIKEREVAIKEQKTMADIENDAKRLEIEARRVESQERIAGAKIGAETAGKEKELDARQFIEGAKLGVQAVMQSGKEENTQSEE
jgi:hypothetical protein